MNGSSNLLVLGVAGQVGEHVAQTLKKREAIFFGRVAKESESGRACRSIWSVALYQSR